MDPPMIIGVGSFPAPISLSLIIPPVTFSRILIRSFSVPSPPVIALSMEGTTLDGGDELIKPPLPFHFHSTTSKSEPDPVIGSLSHGSDELVDSPNRKFVYSSIR